MTQKTIIDNCMKIIPAIMTCGVDMAIKLHKKLLTEQLGSEEAEKIINEVLNVLQIKEV